MNSLEATSHYGGNRKNDFSLVEKKYKLMPLIEEWIYPIL